MQIDSQRSIALFSCNHFRSVMSDCLKNNFAKAEGLTEAFREYERGAVKFPTAVTKDVLVVQKYTY